jgi:hypothetical protein
MNDQHFAQQCRQLLDELAQRLPYRARMRLQESRRQALARLPAPAQAPGLAPQAARPRVPAGASDPVAPPRPGLLWRVSSVAVPLLVVLVGLYGISLWKTDQDVFELVEVDAALLTDEVPIWAYADRGFGVFLRNTRQ